MDYDGLQSYLRNEADQRNPFVAPVYNEVVNDDAVYEKSTMEGIGTFALQHSGINSLKRVLKASKVFSEDDAAELTDSIAAGEGKEGLQRLATRLSSRGLKKLGSKVQDLADKAKSFAKDKVDQALGREAAEPPVVSEGEAGEELQDMSTVPKPVTDSTVKESDESKLDDDEEDEDAPKIPEEDIDPGEESGLSDAVKGGLKKFGGDAEDVLEQGLSKAGEIEAIGGGPEDPLADVIAGVVGIGSLIGGMFRKTHHDSYVTPPINHPNFESQFVQKMG